MGDHQRRRGGSAGEDRISGLPDELLHSILVRLRCAKAAARTSVLSRRWRHVWAHLPELHLVGPLALPGGGLLCIVTPRPAAIAAALASFPDAVDGALAGYLAPTLQHLSISLKRGASITAGRVAAWLRFAAEHVAGEIHLHVLANPSRKRWFFEFEPDPELVRVGAALELPACQGAKGIELSVPDEWRLRLPPSGLFRSLTALTIRRGCMEASELTSLVCKQCPCLRDLNLSIELIAVSDVSFHSSSLYSVVFLVRNTRRLEIVAPKLEGLTVRYPPMEAHISAPKLAEVVWRAGDYGPRLFRFADVGRSIRLLDISTTRLFSSLLKQFGEVDELKLDIKISEGVAGYESFLNETNKLPKCTSIGIFLTWGHHAFMPSMLHLLKRCNSAKKISFCLAVGNGAVSCPLSCPCHLEENHKFDGIALSSLEEVEINGFTGSLAEMELVELLFCNAATLRRLIINYRMFSARANVLQICEKIRGICPANIEVKFCAFLCDWLVPFD